MFGSYVLFGTRWATSCLADTVSQRRLELTSGHGVALLIETNERGTRAIVVFESGRADLVVLDDLTTPVQRKVANLPVPSPAPS